MPRLLAEQVEFSKIITDTLAQSHLIYANNSKLIIPHNYRTGVVTKSGKGSERRQIMYSVLLFSRDHSRFELAKKKLTDQNLE